MHEALLEYRLFWLTSHSCTEEDVQRDEFGEFICKGLTWIQNFVKLEEKVYLPKCIQNNI